MFGHTKKTRKTTKSTRTRKAARKQASSVNQVQEDTEALEQCESVESAVNNSFFYTSDKFFAQMDNIEIMKSLITAYPGFSSENTDSVIKKSLIEMLDDDTFINHTLKYYNITIHEFFMILYKQYASIFRGPYLKKVKQLLLKKRYAQPKRSFI